MWLCDDRSIYRSKNNSIRAGCAQLITRLIERVGAVNALNSGEFPKLMKALLGFAKDPSPAVRQHGKQALQLLTKDQAMFDRTARRVLSDVELRALNEVLESIRKRVSHARNSL
ncbi:unnamed protein product [Anisakis simplex]|uniref:Protein FAM179A (inferred by orthology to a human protein) n=1 Tax=Anisakis simplex TaxID=6269 RepID=A0A0M3JJM0_ANISI|nr:unnamed protein product [Anisakis simplex]